MFWQDVQLSGQEVTVKETAMGEDIHINRRTVLQAGIAAVGALAAGSISAAGSASQSSLTRLATAQDTPSAGGELIVGIASKYIDVLDPNVTAQTVAHQVMAPMFDTLIYQDRDGTYHPGLASEWEISADGLVYTFTLREGVTFHDDTPFDAEAAKANFERMISSEAKSRLAGPRLSGVYKSSEALNPTTLQITLETPSGSFIPDLSQNFMAMLSPTAVSEYGPDEIGRHPTGTGPFKLTEWVENSHVKMERNEAYAWASPMFKNQGTAYLDSITFRIVPEGGSRLAAFESGELNITEQVPTIDFARISEDDKYTVYNVPQPGVPYSYMINTKLPPTDDLVVRQAINMAVDKQYVIDSLYQGLYTPAYGPLSKVSFGYNPAVEELYPYDPEAAGQLLEDAGWVADSDGKRSKDGNPLEIIHYVFTDTLVAESMQAELDVIGVTTNVTLLEVGAVNEAATNGDVTNLAPLPFRDADPAILSVILSSENEGKGFAWTFHTNAELDEELALGQSTTDPEERIAHYGNAQMIAMEEALLIPIYDISALWASLASVRDVSFDVKGTTPWFYDVWLQED